MALLVGLACVVGASCSSGSDQEAVVPDFLGELVQADLDGWQLRQANDGRSTAFASGGPNSPLLVGPATLHLADGTVIDVPAGTPGGNLCEALGWPDDVYEVKCVVVGKFDDHGAAAWFAAGGLEVDGESNVQMDVERFEDRDAIVRLGEVLFAVPIRPDATLVCSEPGDLSSSPVRVPSRNSGATLNDDFAVTSVYCYYSE